MFGLELLSAAILYSQPQVEPRMRPTQVVSQISCNAPKPPKINILPSKSRVRYDFTKKKAQLNSVDIDTVSPYGPNHQTMVSGLMSGAIQIKHEVSFLHETYDMLDQGCVYLSSVDVMVHIDPTIYIAKEYPPGSCMHNSVLNHERKHVREDQLIVNKYANQIGHALTQVVNSQRGSFGPYETARMPFVQKNVQNSITKVIKRFNDQMNLERQRRQQAIDTIEEYESIGKECPESERRR